MNKCAMMYYDTEVYKNYKSNIEILEDTVSLRSDFLGNNVSLYIIDNNRKYWKKHRLSGDFLGPDSTSELTRCVDVLLTDYIRSRIGYAIKQEINNKLVEDWREINAK